MFALMLAMHAQPLALYTGRRTSALALTLAFGFGSALTGCNVQHEKVEASIKEKLAEDDVELESIKCPSDKKLEKGGTFECQGTSSKGDDFVVTVEQTDAQGSISWQLVGRIIDPKQISKNAKDKLGIELDCGKKKFIAVKGTKLPCKANGKDLVLKFKDDEGDIDATALEQL
jgi:hypothetical protein